MAFGVKPFIFELNGSVWAGNDQNPTEWVHSSEKQQKPDWFGLFLAKTDPNLIDLDCFSRKWTQTWLIWTVSRENGPKPDWFGLFFAKMNPNLIEMDCFSRKWTQTWLIWIVIGQVLLRTCVKTVAAQSTMYQNSRIEFKSMRLFRIL